MPKLPPWLFGLVANLAPDDDPEAIEYLLGKHGGDVEETLDELGMAQAAAMEHEHV